MVFFSMIDSLSNRVKNQRYKSHSHIHDTLNATDNVCVAKDPTVAISLTDNRFSYAVYRCWQTFRDHFPS